MKIPAEKWDLTELNNLLLPIIPLKSVVLTDEQKKSMKKNELKHTLKEALRSSFMRLRS